MPWPRRSRPPSRPPTGKRPPPSSPWSRSSTPVRTWLRPGPAGPILGVMKAVPTRSKGMNETVAAPATEIPTDADLSFDELYRRARDDVHAYVAGLLRDRSAAEGVTAPA